MPTVALLFALFPLSLALDYELLWTFTAKYEMCSTPTFNPVTGLLYAGSYDDNMYALDPARNGSVRWNFTTHNQIYSVAALADGGSALIFSE